MSAPHPSKAARTPEQQRRYVIARQIERLAVDLEKAVVRLRSEGEALRRGYNPALVIAETINITNNAVNTGALVTMIEELEEVSG